MLRFCCFNPIPWPRLRRRPERFPFPNADFDPVFAHDYFRSQIEQLIFAEQADFDWVALGEDHMTAYGLTPNPNLLLSIVAHATTRVKLAIFGAPLPLLNPLRVAEECSMLDVISNGRLVVGFIRGVPQNYAAYNVEPDESRERFSEAAALIVKAWTTREPFSWNGRFYRFPVVSIWPLPVQQPHPPLLFSANSAESAVVGARQRAMIGAIHLYTRDSIQRVATAIDAYKAQARIDGWDATPDRFVLGLQTCIASTDADAERLMEPALRYQYEVLSGTYDAEKRAIARTKPGYGASPVEEHPPSLAERLALGIVLCGSPARVVDQIHQLRERLGIGVLSMQFQIGNLSEDVAREGMRLFQAHVAPHFR